MWLAFACSARGRVGFVVGRFTVLLGWSVWLQRRGSIWPTLVNATTSSTGCFSAFVAGRVAVRKTSFLAVICPIAPRAVSLTLTQWVVKQAASLSAPPSADIGFAFQLPVKRRRVGALRVLKMRHLSAVKSREDECVVDTPRESVGSSVRRPGAAIGRPRPVRLYTVGAHSCSDNWLGEVA